MTQHPETSTGADDARPPRGGLRRLLTVPMAVASTLAVTLGIVQPADAAPQTEKRASKPKAPRPGAAPATAAAAVAPAEVIVAEGDTVSGIAARYGLSTAEVLAKNGLSWSSLIFPGQRLALPGPAATRPSAPPSIARHVVAEGETITAIAARYGLATGDLLRANGLGTDSLIFPGQGIVLPGPGDGPAPVLPVEEVHAVVAGDTLLGIAVRHGTTVPRLLELNDLDRADLIHPGQRIVVRRVDPATPAVVSLDVALDDEMRENARIIVAVGRELGVPDRGIVVALAAAAQESGLRNLRHGDLDSLGLFQQRPSQGWGTPEEILDPVRAARAFYGGPSSPTVGVAPGLLDVDGWTSMSVTEAAQAVQESAHPGHYAKWEASARRWLAELG